MESPQQSPSEILNPPMLYESYCKDIHVTSQLTFPSNVLESPLNDVTNKSTKSHNTHSCCSSTFGDVDCGEPMKPQRLIIDFTPDDAIDTEESQKKCSDFWTMINGNPYIQHLMALPDASMNMKSTADGDTFSSTSSEELECDYPDKERTATSLLKTWEDKDQVKSAFEPKLCLSHCSEESRDYILQPARSPTCAPSVNTSFPEVAELCKTLEDWDEKHPKFAFLNLILTQF